MSRRDLKLRLDQLSKPSFTQPVPENELKELKTAAIYWSVMEHQLGAILRLARFIRFSSGTKEQLAFLAEAREQIRVPKLELLYSQVLEDLQLPKQALAVLSPLLSDSDAELLLKAGKLNAKLYNWADAVVLFRRALSAGIDCRSHLIHALVALKDGAAAVELADQAMNDANAAAELLLACYSAFLHLHLSDEKTDLARALAIRTAKSEGLTSAWWYRFYRTERNYPEAISALTETLRYLRSDPRLIKERAVLAIQSGEWGRYSGEILEARKFAPESSALGSRITAVSEFFRYFDTSIDEAAENATYTHLQTPHSIFEKLCNQPAPARRDQFELDLVMVANSLGPGGAERITAILAHHISHNTKYRMKLYLLDSGVESKQDFYLPLADLPAEDVVYLDRNCEQEAPISFLPLEHAKTTQAILNRLRLDRPAIVYAALEPLTVYCGLAGILSGAQRVFLHTHNMPPPMLNPRAEFLERLQACYRFLLKNTDVTMLTCANAASTAYAEWLGGHELDIRCLHNGLETHALDSVDRAARAALREEIGITSGDSVIGTAFNFREEKQPTLWVDAAEFVISRNPACRFVMYGDGKLWDATRQYIQAKGLSEYFFLPGLVTDLYRRLPALDLFVLSSRSEALPNVLIEAQAAGVPVVSFDVGGISETMMPDITGVLATGMSSADLANAVLRALNDRAWLDNASRVAPQFVQEHFAVDKMLRSFENLIGRLHRR